MKWVMHQAKLETLAHSILRRLANALFAILIFFHFVPKIPLYSNYALHSSAQSLGIWLSTASLNAASVHKLLSPLG